jgi:hypothetical protein
MDPLLPNGALRSFPRALALGLSIETVEPLLNQSIEGPLPPPGQRELWQALRSKCGELSALVLRANDPGEAAEYVLGYLPKHFEYVFEQLFGQRHPLRMPPGRSQRHDFLHFSPGD